MKANSRQVPDAVFTTNYLYYYKNYGIHWLLSKYNYWPTLGKVKQQTPAWVVTSQGRDRHEIQIRTNKT